MTKKHRNITGNYTYRCMSCDLIFLPEEMPNRYIKNKKTCVRCLVNAKNALGEIHVPSCYGIRYDGFEEACVRHCTLREACIVQTVDTSSTAWAIDRRYLSLKQQKHRGGRFHHMHHVVRILRSAGRPMHLEDISPITAYNNGGQEVYQKDRQLWNNKVLRACERCDAIVCLGGNFFVWIGVWNLHNGGVIRKEFRKPEAKLLSLEEIFKDL